MDVFDFIDKHIERKLIPYLRLMTIYTNDGVVSGVCLVRFNDKKISRKASKLGLTEERIMKNDGAGTKLENPKPYNIQNGNYYLYYRFDNHDLSIFKL